MNIIPEDAWISAPAIPLDLNGPVDCPRRRFGSDDPGRPVLDRLREVVSAIPDHIAVDDGAIRLSFRQLWSLAINLGNAVAAAAPEPAPVGILLPQESFYLAALFAGLAADRPAVLLDKQAPVARNTDILRDSGATSVILRAEDARDIRLPTGVVPVLVETAMLAASDRQSGPVRGLAVDDPAFILYTSGSSGQPKGVAMSQRSWSQHMYLQSTAARWGTEDAGLRLGPVATVWGLNTNGGLILNGATAHIMDLNRDGIGGALTLIQKRSITVLHAGPSLVKALVRMPGADVALTGLRLVGLGGEPLLLADVAEIRSGLPKECSICNLLAATETYIGQWFLTEPQGYDSIRSSAGYICPGYEVSLLDEGCQPAAPGQEGELIVRSRYVALGDWRNGRLDNTRFPTDFSDPTRRIYRTGDIARIAKDGMITVLGRRDRMIKINGQRVEPAEIEAALRRRPEVLDSIVLPWQSGDRVRLAAFVVPRGAAADCLAADLHEALRDELPGFLVPHRVEIRSEFPMLPGGKIDVQALVASLAIPATSQPNSRPAVSSESYAIVLRVWQKTLGHWAPFDRSFSDSGGDSLQLMQVVFRLERALGIALPLEAFFLDATIQDFARIVDRERGAGPPKSETAGAPIFFLPGLGGFGPQLATFRAACTTQVSVEFLDWGTWRTYSEPGFDAKNLLRDLAEQVGARAPNGPISLAGYSIGGPIAHRLARDLVAAGREVVFLGLLDADSMLRSDSTTGQNKPSRRSEFMRRMQPPKEGSIFAQGLARPIANSLSTAFGRKLLEALRRSRPLALPADLEFFVRRRLNRNLRERILRAGLLESGFLAPLQSVATTLFWADWRGPDVSSDLGWSRFCPDLHIVPVTGTHVTLLDHPQIIDLAEKFASAVQHARKIASLPQATRD